MVCPRCLDHARQNPKSKCQVRIVKVEVANGYQHRTKLNCIIVIVSNNVCS